MSDLAALLQEAGEHLEVSDSNPQFRSDCEVCGELWPCLVHRLASEVARLKEQRHIVAGHDGPLDACLYEMCLHDLDAAPATGDHQRPFNDSQRPWVHSPHEEH